MCGESRVLALQRGNLLLLQQLLQPILHPVSPHTTHTQGQSSGGVAMAAARALGARCDRVGVRARCCASGCAASATLSAGRAMVRAGRCSGGAWRR